ncbi:hypothetical protein JCM10212_004655 [Sporobolomyces blumeae]
MPAMPVGPLVSIPHVTLYLVQSSTDATSDPFLIGRIALSAVASPPPVPPRPAKSSIGGSSEKLSSTPPPLPPRSKSPSPSSTPREKWLQLSLTVDGDSDPLFTMPVDTASSATSITPLPLENAYVVPNLSGVDPSTLPRSSASSNGYIKIKLPSTHDSAVDAHDRELFEALLYGHVPTAGLSTTSSSTNPFDDPPSPEGLERGQLYVVDENDGRILGQLESGGGAIALEEASEVSTGKMHDGAAQAQSTGVGAFDLDGNEAVVINSLETTSEKPGGGGGIRFSVKPLSNYQPAANPTSSTIIDIGNFVSKGLLIGSNLIAQGLETGAGKFVSSTPATQSPLVFKETTKARFDKGHVWTGKAVQLSGKATGYVGNLASSLGDKIGRSAGIQSTPSGAPPTGVRGLISKSLTAINTVADNLDVAGKTILESGTKSTSQVVHHKYGAEARDLVDSAGGSIKHCALVYIDARGVTRRALLTSVGKSAIKARMADGSQLYLTDSSASSAIELKQLEAAASSVSVSSSSSSRPVTSPAPPYTDSTTNASGSSPIERVPSSSAASFYSTRSGPDSGASTPNMTGGYPMSAPQPYDSLASKKVD